MSPTRWYIGVRAKDGPRVAKLDDLGKEHRLPPRNDLDNHSPDGFEWGYAGSGPAQLALAILADALGDDRRAIELHQKFKDAFVQNFDHAAWSIKAADVRVWAVTLGRE